MTTLLTIVLMTLPFVVLGGLITLLIVVIGNATGRSAK
jgi:hypothetical protein